MEYYDVNDEACIGYRVEFNGKFRDDVVEASATQGWIRITKKTTTIWGQVFFNQQTLYGKVFIVRYEGWDKVEDLPVPENPEPTYE